MRSVRSVAAVLALAVASLPAAASAATITGRVTDLISGAAVADVVVGAGPVGYGLRDYTTTGADGTFAIDEHDAGRYNVCYFPDPATKLLERCWRDEHMPIYGEPIDVPESGTVDGIDTALAPATTVVGTVTDWAGDPLAGVCVTAWTPHSGWLRVADATTAADGSYTLLGLTPGAVNKIVFGPDAFWTGHCTGEIDHPGIVAQWFDHQGDVDSATSVTTDRSETLAGVDASLGPSSGPPPGTTPPPPCVVPSLRSRTFANARAALTRAGCSTPMPALRRSRAFRRGRVITSQPAAKSRLRRGHPVKLTVSHGR